MISNIILIAFALSSCFGNDKASTKGSDANPGTLKRNITATERNRSNNSSKPYIKNMDQIVELAEKYVDEGNVDAFNKLLEQNSELLTEKLEARGKGYFSKENNILHMIVDKADIKVFSQFVNTVKKYKVSFVKMAHSENGEGVKPILMDIDRDKRVSVLYETVVSTVMLSANEVLNAVEEGDIDFIKLAYYTILDMNNYKESTFSNLFKQSHFNSTTFLNDDLLVIAIKSGQIDILDFLVNEVSLSTSEIYGKADFVDKNGEESSIEAKLTYYINQVDNDVVRNRMLEIIQ